MQQAIKRRVMFELGMDVQNIRVALPDYKYKTPPYNGIIENEVCPVFFAETHSSPRPNIDEVGDYKWVSWQDFTAATQQDADDTWSWWCKDQLKHLSPPS